MNSLTRTCARSSAVLLAALCVLASVTVAAEPVSLSNGVAVTGLSGAAGSETFYKIDVPAGQDTLEISTSEGTGDVDLYVRRGSQPTTSSYDYRPYKVGNNETVSVENPAGGTWYIMLRGYTAYAGVTLKASYSAAISVKPLTNGVPATGISGAQSAELYYSIVVPAGQTKLEIAMSGGTGDADLYVKKGSLPTTTSYDYRPFLLGNNETAAVDNPAAATWYIMIRGYNAFSGITLLASYGGGMDAILLKDGVAVTNISGSAGNEKFYYVELPAGLTRLEIKMSGGTGDADLYVRRGSKPTTTEYDYRPFLAGNDETVLVTNPAGGTWYVMIRGYTDFSGITLRASYADVVTLQDEVPVTNLSGSLNSEKFFKIDVPAGQDSISFNLSGGTGNADMYIRKGDKPTTATWDYRPYQSGNTESIAIGGAEVPGTWYVMLKAAQAYDGVRLVADYSVVETTVTLSNGVPVSGISGPAGSEKFFKIEVPTGQQKLEIRMSGGTGDADLYVRKGSKPTASEYDHRPYLIGNDESVTVNNPAPGTWYIMIRGYQAFSGITLQASYGGTIPDTVVTLQNGVAVTGISGTAGSEKFYKIDVPAGQAKLEVAMSGGTGDVDLYVRKGSKPTTTEWDYRPYLIGNNETVTIDNPQAATYYIMLKGYTAFDGVTLKATYVPVPEQIVTLQNGVPVTGLSGASGSEKFFKIDVPAGQDSLTIETSGGSGDLDMYVKKGAKPTLTTWDYRPYLIGNNEKVEIANPAAATWYIMLRGYVAYSGATLTATYGVQTVGNNFGTDPNCISLWRFEPDKLLVDSIGPHPLTAIDRPEVNATTFKEGLGSASFVRTQGRTDRLYVAGKDLENNYPLTSTDKDRKVSVAMWFQPTVLSSAMLYTHGDPASTVGTFQVAISRIDSLNYVTLRIAYDDGTSSNLISFKDVVLASQNWYHLAVTYNNSDRSYRVVLYDAKTDTTTQGSGTFAKGIGTTNGTVCLGGLVDSTGFSFSGLMDECVVLNDILTVAEIEKIRKGTYGKK